MRCPSDTRCGCSERRSPPVTMSSQEPTSILGPGAAAATRCPFHEPAFQRVVQNAYVLGPTGKLKHSRRPRRCTLSMERIDISSACITARRTPGSGGPEDLALSRALLHLLQDRRLRRISRPLAEPAWRAALHFTGLGGSGGDFGNIDLSSKLTRPRGGPRLAARRTARRRC